MSPTLSAIPPELQSLPAGKDFLKWLRAVPAPAHYKKAILFDWAKAVGHRVTEPEILYLIPGGDARRSPDPSIIVSYPDEQEPPDSIVVGLAVPRHP